MALFLLIVMGASVLLAMGTVFVVVLGRALEDRLAVLDRRRTEEIGRLRERQRALREAGRQSRPDPCDDPTGDGPVADPAQEWS
jgi:hypothetical protein